MEEIKQKILAYVKRNRVSSTEVADCLGKQGAIADIMQVNRGHFAVGPVHYIYGHSNSNWSIHEQARYVKPGEVVIVDGIDVGDRALFGELASKFLILYKEAVAVVALGKLRDANDLIKCNYPIWCKGFTPIGCFNEQKMQTSIIRKQVEERRKMYDNTIAVCDDTGVVIIPQNMFTKRFYSMLELIEKQEDIWFDCIDNKKWNTYDTVCLRKYDKNKGGVL